MATNNPTDNLVEPSHLLALPVELLQRVATTINDETLLMFRSTCKAIESATFDQFAKTFFEERYCYIYHEPRWTQLQDILFSRMAARVHRMIFTTKVLAPASSNQLQLAPKENHTHRTGFLDGCMFGAQSDAHEKMAKAVGPRRQIPAWPRPFTIMRCATMISLITPKTRVELDFEEKNGFWPSDDCTKLQARVLIAFASGKRKFNKFNSPASKITSFCKSVQAQGYEPIPSMRSLQSFSYGEYYVNDREVDARLIVSEMLASVAELRELTLMIYDNSSLDPMVAKMLLANNFAHLESLTISVVSLSEGDLIEALSRCKSTLLKVDARDIRMVGSSGFGAWLKAFGVLASMARLSDVRLSSLQLDGSGSDPDYLMFSRLAGGQTVEQFSTTYEGREQVISGLNELLTIPLKVRTY